VTDEYEAPRHDGDEELTAGGDVEELLATYRTGLEVRDAEGGDDDREVAADGGRCVEPELDPDASLDVTHARCTYDVYGGRQSSGNQKRHLENTEPPTSGWLGNPYPMGPDTVAERRRVIAAYTFAFMEKVQTDADFRAAVEGLRGQSVACWCRGSTQARQPDNWCHLDVVAAWLDGDLSPVYAYLRGDDA